MTFCENIRFLAYVDLLGTTYRASTIATGYGAHIAQPLLRKAVEGYEDVITEEQALSILETCMKVLFYRDARSLNKVRNKYLSGNDTIFSLIIQYQVATVTRNGVNISEHKELKTSWGFAEGIRGYGAQTQ